jgi:DNA polymerase-1
MSDKKLFLLDAYALAYRSYYAFIKNPRINSKGENTSAVYGFANSLLEVINKYKPDYIGVVFDPSGPNFRHEMYKEYKANREAMPEDMRQSIPYIKEMIEAFNIPVLEVKGYEADDVIGTLAKKAEKNGFEVFMMTPDKDYAQLVSDNIFVFKPARGGNPPEIWTADKVKEKFKVSPENIIDLLGLMGDSSDNIPGCPGIGPKGAEKLITEYDSIEGVYENIDKLKGKQKQNLIDFKDQVLLSKKLVTIDTDVPIEFSEKNLTMEKPDAEKIKDLFERLEFRNLVFRVLGEQTSSKKTIAKKPDAVQGSLFDGFEQQQNEKEIESEKLKNIDTENIDYILLQSDNEINELIKTISSKKEVCFDTETTSLKIHSAKLVGLAIATEENKAYYIPFGKNEDETAAKLNLLKPFFENGNILKVGQNIKYDIMVLMNYGINVKGPFFDTMIAHYLIKPEQRHNLDELARTYLKYDTVKTEELIGKKGKNQLSMADISVDKVKNYACEDADITLQLVSHLRKQLKNSGMEQLFANIDIPLLQVLAKMEYEGVRINDDELKQFSQELKKEAAEIEKRIYEHAGTEFNIASPKQLGEILFDRMKIISNPKKTKTKQYSTGEEILVKLKDKHPIINDILEYRSLKKLITTYVDALPALIHPKTKKIHTSYNQTVTATGRLSSNNPNLQNIPIREERGRKIRKAFIPSDENRVLLAADYSQIELRIMAHLCGDKNMITAFKHGEDIHADTAARIFKIDKSEVTRQQRGFAKGANFGIIYGISSFGLAQNLNISRKEAKEIIDSYFESYPQVKTFMDESIKKVREVGYAETIFGRRRYLPDINSSNAIVRSAAERNAINAPVQGTAADIIKIAMVNIDKRFEAENIKSKMILQVHDELVFDVYKTELDKVKNIVIYEMENAAQLQVPLTVDTGIGNNWLEAH